MAGFGMSDREEGQGPGQEGAQFGQLEVATEADEYMRTAPHTIATGLISSNDRLRRLARFFGTHATPTKRPRDCLLLLRPVRTGCCPVDARYRRRLASTGRSATPVTADQVEKSVPESAYWFCSKWRVKGIRRVTAPNTERAFDIKELGTPSCDSDEFVLVLPPSFAGHC
ncbi:unnamed protein product [Protopolystoma xenopodis]|uniref:Uncharacterized protein n=1 Tax=Protopolystoma xenopodis TaxID=117903 RepID=A0A448XMQ4_9PLAT|nr:unnamed protein product [Protopolystoma xenopodis]